MTERERLKRLLLESDPIKERDLDDDWGDGELDEIVDHLLANGAFLPPVKVRQTVWIYNQTAGKIYQNTVIGIYVVGTSRNKNAIKVEYVNKFGESSCRKFTWAQIGKQVFLTEEEAKKALAERNYHDTENL